MLNDRLKGTPLQYQVTSPYSSIGHGMQCNVVEVVVVVRTGIKMAQKCFYVIYIWDSQCDIQIT